jgi:dienelactone hydrolase
VTITLAPRLFGALLQCKFAEDDPWHAVVALHGCGGLFNTRGQPSARHADWGTRLAAMGFVVLFPDSFGSRGFGSQCTVGDRQVLPGRERVRDAVGARAWLQAQPYVDLASVSLLGWSNGGSSVLYAASRTAKSFANGPDFRKAVALYPGCATLMRRGYSSRLPLLVLVGQADNWTPAAPCQALAENARAMGDSVDIVTYPGAYHDFDHPNLPIRERAGLAFTADRSGRAFIGTNPAARRDTLVRVPAFLTKP